MFKNILLNKRQLSLFFLKLVEIQNFPTTFITKTSNGITKNYLTHQVKILDWPQSIHYEFYSLKYTCGIEIHLEHDRVKPISDLLINFSKTLVNKFPNGKVKWDPKWYRGRGKLMVQYDNNIDPMEIAKGMKKLVGLTNEKISKELQNIGVI